MDFTITNNSKLLDELIQVLERHHDELGVAAALDDLKAAKTNYLQRSMDHMMNCLVLTTYDLVVHPPSKELLGELQTVIHRYVMGIFEVGSKMAELARQYEASGGKLLSDDEILSEVNER